MQHSGLQKPRRQIDADDQGFVGRVSVFFCVRPYRGDA